jgi:hypothetical protein
VALQLLAVPKRLKYSGIVAPALKNQVFVPFANLVATPLGF